MVKVNTLAATATHPPSCLSVNWINNQTIDCLGVWLHHFLSLLRYLYIKSVLIITERVKQTQVKISPERRSYRGVAKALKQRREEERNKEIDSDSALSEEQFKCWEYMLEQNTQLLFDKVIKTLLIRLVLICVFYRN